MSSMPPSAAARSYTALRPAPPVFCPFADHALDNQFKGDDLVVIQNSDNGLTYRADTAGQPRRRVIGRGRGRLGQPGNLQASSGPAANLINVEVSAMAASFGPKDRWGLVRAPVQTIP